MSKIYVRDSMKTSSKEKSEDENRKRNRIVNFRTTDEERDLIFNRIELSGLNKQDFFLSSCLHQSIVTVGNIKTFSKIKEEMKVINTHLQQVIEGADLDEEVIDNLRTIAEIIDGFYKYDEAEKEKVRKKTEVKK